MFEEANKLYHNRQYQQAAELYMQIITDGLHSASVFYNAGNAFYKCKRYGETIWCYEKALQYEPENKIILENLALANAKAKNPNKHKGTLFELSGLKQILHFHTLNKWCLGALLAYLSFTGLLIAGRFRPLPKYTKWLRTALVLVFSIYALGALSNYVFHRLYKHAVVVVEAPAYKQAQDRAPIKNIAEGTIVRVIGFTRTTRLSGGKYRVKTANGKTYWLEAQNLRQL